ncbi:MAG: hypothetical protein KBC00_03185 [Candidatus Levybacteria bacterium]|nr:hypothetical protein [Candidatus Levybacteria bacterium]MBP9815483.1 hypothetical protein [Candidatus Levybacteria bacterium]
MEEDKNSNPSPVQSLTPEKSSPAVPPTSETPKPKLKLPILIGFVVLLLLIISTASATYLFVSKPKNAVIQKQTVEISSPASPTPIDNPTGDWKTYVSNELSFKYPSDMEVFPCEAMVDGKIVSVGIKKIGDKTTYCGIGGLQAIFTISTYGENKTIEDYLTKLPLGTYQTISPIQYREISGFKLGITTLSTEGGFSTQTHALINPVDSKLYYIRSNSDWKTNEILLEQILSTFKFTN